ncbi:hypothetical protein GGR25_002254 [Kaistia hirudinis]|uniref:Uncharacterized protein n=1 Tax=Kaistia hirudinis TaxID=1293440 RepID=A0A840APB1_9HYPH|nr:hypothetical protein [Kaistia hirudinis]MBB3931204.1 hypothetical protein [Kaistia hirudinis]
MKGYSFFGRAVLNFGGTWFGNDWHLLQGAGSFAEARAEIARALLGRLQAGIDRAGYLDGSIVKEIPSDRWGGLTVDAPAFGKCRANPDDLEGNYTWAPVDDAQMRWAPVGASSSSNYYDSPRHRWLFLRLPADISPAHHASLPKQVAESDLRSIVDAYANEESQPSMLKAWKETDRRLSPDRSVTRARFEAAWKNRFPNLKPGRRPGKDKPTD